VKAEQASTQRPSGRIGSLLSGIVNDAQELARDHAELARVEIKESLGKAGRGSALGAAGAAVGGLAALFLLTALALLINIWTANRWLGFALVGVVCALAAGILLAVAKRRLAAAAPPLPKTKQAIKEDVRWASTTLKGLT
jgi:uncharacterized membrane protein YqjE